MGIGLHDGEGPADDLPHALGLAVGRTGLEVDRNHDIGTKLAGPVDGYGGRHEAVDERPTPVLHGQEHAGVRAGGTQSRPQLAFGEIDGRPRAEVRRRDGQRDPQLLEPAGRAQPAQIGLQSGVRGEAQPREGPSPEVLEAGVHRQALHGVERNSVGIEGRDQGADARAGHVVDRHLVLGEDLEHADVGDAAGESACQRQAEAGPRSGSRGRPPPGDGARPLERVPQPPVWSVL